MEIKNILPLFLAPSFLPALALAQEPARQPGGSMLLTGTGLPNNGFRLWATTDLSLPFASWTLVTGNTFDSNGMFSYTDASAASNHSRFYRISIP